MWKKIKALREERGQHLADMKTLLAKAEEEKRSLTDDENTQFSDLEAKAEQRKADLDRYERSQAIEADLGTERRIGREDINTPEQRAGSDADAEIRTFNDFCRDGEIRATNTVTTATGGGVWVPKQVTAVESIAKLGNSLKAALAFYGIPEIPVAGKVNISVPVLDLGDGGELAGNAETESLATSSDASVAISVTTYNSKPQWLDNGIITAQTYDAASSLVPVLRVACERGQEAAFYAASIMTTALKAAARETATASTVAYGDLSPLLFDLGAYAVGRTAYLVSMSTLSAMHSMTDDNGYPINKLTKDGSGQYYWDGVPVFPTTALEAIADGKFVAAAINVDACRAAASASWVHRYDNNSARPNQTGFDYLQYAGFGIKATAVKLLKVKAAG